LNEVKDDDETSKVLDEAKKEAKKITDNIKITVEKFKKDLPKSEALDEVKKQFDETIKKVAKETENKVKGINIFSDIAKLKVGANR